MPPLSQDPPPDARPAGGGPAHVVVIGAGIVGTCTALALLADGRRVTLVDPGPPGAEQAASYGNAAWLSPGSVVPMSMPGVWKQVPGYLLDPLGPLTIRWRHLPALMPWLVRYLRAGRTRALVSRTAAVLNGLLHDAPERHAALAEAQGCGGLIRREGLLYAYPDRAAFEAEALSWSLRRENAVAWREMEGEALHAFEPALGPEYTFGAFVESGAWCTDPGGYVAALARAAESRGARIVTARAIGFGRDGARLRAVLTEHGEIACDGAVIAAGIRSAALAAGLGDRVPMASERGYHVQLPDAAGGPARAIMPSDGKMGNTPLAAGLRAAGQVELASVDAPADWRRTDILLRNLRRAYPGLAFDPAKVRRWMGHRPSTPDGLPVIGPARGLDQVLYAFGHGHVGLASGPATAALVAALFAGTAPHLDPSPFSARRF